MVERRPCIWVLAGTNGGGKSSIAGAMLRASGGEYFNPDEVARSLRRREPQLAPREANALAWALGLRQLEHAIEAGHDYFFETTLGGKTIASRLSQAIAGGHDVRIWYVGLDAPERHVARVKARVRRGGHDIPEADIRRRYDSSRRNLIALLPRLAELKVYDNSAEADPATGRAPRPELVLHLRGGRIVAPRRLAATPAWAKPIVARAIQHAER